jgi:DNA-binding LacI/PurR family transcriptional regulator
MMSKSRQQSGKRATIKDVAQVAGVSVTTVSNVLNNRTRAMAAETLHRVQAAIHSLNYHPSQVARSLVTSQTATIGVIVNEITTPLFLQVLNVIEPIARNADYNILLCIARNLEDEVQAVNLLLEKDVDGIIFLSNSFYLDDDFLTRLSPSAPPVVLINRASSHDRFDQIQFDNFNGVIKAIDYLAALGHHHIAHLHGLANRRSFEDRLSGYCQALQQHQLEYRKEYVRPADYEAPQKSWKQATRALLALSPRPTAIIAANDVIAATVIRTVQRAGLRVPQDISIVGVDDQHFCTYLNPALTTVQIPIIEAGERAIELLLARIAGERTTAEHLILPCPLVERESAGQALN